MIKDRSVDNIKIKELETIMKRINRTNNSVRKCNGLLFIIQMVDIFTYACKVNNIVYTHIPVKKWKEAPSSYFDVVVAYI